MGGKDKEIFSEAMGTIEWEYVVKKKSNSLGQNNFTTCMLCINLSLFLCINSRFYSCFLFSNAKKTSFSSKCYVQLRNLHDNFVMLRENRYQNLF